jgi:dTDP-4-amino-4,6-dideoxygalactose transaminase
LAIGCLELSKRLEVTGSTDPDMKKTQLTDLAIFGGQPAFAEPLHVGRPNIGDRDRLMARLNDMLDRRWLTNDGPLAKEFERKIAELAGVRHCLAACNATVALEMAVRAAGMTGEVIVPSFTFVATAHALQWQGITPVFCDVDPVTYNLDPARVRELITPRTTGILAVHVFGRACDVDGLTELAREHGLKLIFDAAHAVGGSRNGQMIGSGGSAEVFSFHATKVLNAFEGGAIVTNDDELAARVRKIRNFGYGSYDDVVCLGTNGKMSEASAAMGLTSLEAFPLFIEANRCNYKEYEAGLGGIPGLTFVRHDESERCNYQYVVVQVNAAEDGLSRDQLQQILWRENILARRYFYPGCHQMEPYRTMFPEASRRLGVTESLSQTVMTLPTGTAVTADDVRTICQIVRLALAHGVEAEARLSQQLVHH